MGRNWEVGGIGWGFQHPGRDLLSSGSAEKCREDGRNGLPSLSGSNHPVGGGIRAVDDGHGAIIPGEAEIHSAVFGVWGGNGNGVINSPSTEAAWEGIGRWVALGDHRPR